MTTRYSFYFATFKTTCHSVKVKVFAFQRCPPVVCTLCKHTIRLIGSSNRTKLAACKWQISQVKVDESRQPFPLVFGIAHPSSHGCFCGQHLLKHAFFFTLVRFKHCQLGQKKTHFNVIEKHFKGRFQIIMLCKVLKGAKYAPIQSLRLQ